MFGTTYTMFSLWHWPLIVQIWQQIPVPRWLFYSLLWVIYAISAVHAQATTSGPIDIKSRKVFFGYKYSYQGKSLTNIKQIQEIVKRPPQSVAALKKARINDNLIFFATTIGVVWLLPSVHQIITEKETLNPWVIGAGVVLTGGGIWLDVPNQRKVYNAVMDYNRLVDPTMNQTYSGMIGFSLRW